MAEPVVVLVGHCRDCQHWEAVEVYNHRETAVGWGECRLGAGENGYARQEGTLAFASDAEAYAARLNTRSNFGCVQFQAPATKEEWDAALQGYREHIEAGTISLHDPAGLGWHAAKGRR